MKIHNTQKGIVIEHEDKYYSWKGDWDSLVNRPRLFFALREDLKKMPIVPDAKEWMAAGIKAPIGSQEVWASGVTYLRSREARMEESKDAGGGDFYARVYDAARPELFFKAPAYRVVGPRAKVRIRRDSNWNVPEPELTLFICSAGSIEGYTVGNDMSSRDIEGENPLYLPQAKSYDGSTSIGPCLYVPEAPIQPDAMISISIKRGGSVQFANEISINRMRRKHIELAEYLFREVTFPYGTYLMTGTGIVPPDQFTLQPGDEIAITIQHIGSLENTVA